MNTAKFSFIGTQGSGKTCFLVGMYHEMRSGIEGYTLTVKDGDKDVDLCKKWDKMYDQTQGRNRFPQGTDQGEEYIFQLNYAYKKVQEFKWYDYRGGILEEKEANYEDYNEFQKMLLESICLFVCIDGELLVGGDKKDKIRKVKDRCSNTVNHYIQRYSDENKKLPPIVLLVTKYDLCQQEVDKILLNEILQEAFTALYADDERNIAVVIPVSLGKIGEECFGEISPINIHVPLFLGIWYSMKREYQESNNDNELKQLEDEMKKLKTAIELKEKRKLSKLTYSKKKRKCDAEVLAEKEDEYGRCFSRKQEYENYIAKLRRQIDSCGLPIFVGGQLSSLDNIF